MTTGDFGDFDVSDSVAPRGGPVAGGKRAPIEPAGPLPAWPADAADADYGLLDDDVSFSDLESVNRDLVRLRVRMNRVRGAMKGAQRDAAHAKLRYQRELRRALIRQSGGSAESRKAAAELLTEELEADYVMRQQVADEYSTLFRSIRDEMEASKVIAYNVRTLSSII